MSKQPDEISVVRQWIGTQREKIANEIYALQMKLKMLDQMEREALSDLPQPKSVAVVKERHRIAKNSKVQDAVMLALDAAGKQGLTAREAAAVTHLPIGSASSRLSMLATAGVVNYKQPRYFVVHSTQEDNNIDQGGTNGSKGA